MMPSWQPRTITARSRQHTEQSWHDAQRRLQLGAIAPSTVRANEKQFHNARLSEIRATAARLADTATLFQAMGIAHDEHLEEGKEDRSKQ